MAATKKGAAPEKGTKSGKKKKTSVLADLRYGRSVSLEYLKNNAWLLIVFMVLVISLIGMRYKTKTKMQEIKNLQDELAIAESERLVEKSKYMSLIRENEMIQLVNKKGIGLIFQEQPPYELEVKGD